MAHNEKADDIVNLRIIHLGEADNKTPTVALSTVLFISGGALWFKGFDGTYTELAVK